MANENKLTLAGLAKLAGVSTSTVSRALKDNPLIKKEGCFKNSGVLIILDHQLYLKENIEMLNILNNSGVLDIYNDQVFVKLHPMDDIDNYKSNILKKYNINYYFLFMIYIEY